MAMTVGSVSINASTAAETKSGAAEAVYDALKATTPTASDATEVKLRAASRQALADIANASAALITYIIANAEAVIETGDSGLQRTPNPNNADTATQGPATEKSLSIR